MKKIHIILLVLLVIILSSFMERIVNRDVSFKIAPDTLWKPYQIINQVNGSWTAHWIKGIGSYSGTYPAMVVLKDQYGDKTVKWLKEVFDAVPTGNVAKFNFTDNSYAVSGWNDCVYADSASFTPVADGSTGFTIGIYSPSAWGGTHGANNGYIPNDGGGYAYPDTVVNTLWYNFEVVGAGQAFIPNLFISGLDTTKLYKVQYLSSTWGNGGSDTVANYSAVIFQNPLSASDTSSTGYSSGNAFHNTHITITTPYIKAVGGKINMQMGTYANAYSGYGTIDGLIITEYKIQE